MKPSKSSDISYDIPTATRHDFKLKSGRNLSYYTFQDTSHQTAQENPKQPVLYFHGFPGCGLEGSLCASEIADAGGKLYAPDRPGLGHSDECDASLLSADEQLGAYINDLWEFVMAQKWRSFSIVAVSGGGPFALAFLTFYLQQKAKQSNTGAALPSLDAVSLVAAICCTAGTKGIMKTNETIMNLVKNQDKLLSRWVLNLMFAIPYYLVKIVPSSWLLKLTPTKDLPAPDQEIMANTQVSNHMLNVLLLALRQGYRAAVKEACIIFRAVQGYEPSLHDAYRNSQSNDLPRIAIYQGHVDVNVPKFHAQYMHDLLFSTKCDLLLFPNIGHLSLVVTKATNYSKFALCP